MRTRASILCICAIVVCAAASSFAAQVEGYRAPGHFDPTAYQAEQQLLADNLAQAEIAAGLAEPFTLRLSPAEMVEAEAADARAERKMRAGLAKPVDVLVDLGALELGAKRSTERGVLWSGAVRSVGATAIRLHFSDLALSEGAELYIYNRTGDAFGPYTGRGPLGSGEFWSHTIVGDTVLIQLRGAQADDYFRIADVGHLGSNFPYAHYRHDEQAAKSFCSFNASCVENASCGSSSAVSTAEDAVAHYTFIQRPYIYMCSGGLIADEANSGTPYFLTANHCVSKDRIAGTVETYFFFTTPCNGSCYSPSPAHTVGASIAASNSTGDYTILRLAEPAPAGAAFLGWSTNPIAYTSNAMLYRISHPSGAPQAYSEHKVDTATGTCSSWPRGSWIYSEDVYGATEGGSSGSPVVNSAGEVVGQLSGACGYNLNDVCDSSSNATVDGAFASYYPEVASILGDGGGSSCDVDEDGDGYYAASCGGDDCNDNDASVNPGATEFCGDNIDNNCDGTIDEGCGGGECLPQGDACTTGSECCSGLCHPRKLTCK